MNSNSYINSNNILHDQDDYHFRFKVVVLGDTKVGKSSFLDSIYFLISNDTTQWQGCRFRDL